MLFCLVGAAFAATLASSKAEGLGLWGAASSVTLGVLKAGVRGESSSYQKDDIVLVGAAFAATLAPSKAEGLGLWGAASSVTFGVLKAESSGRKPLLPKRTMSFW